MVTVHTYPKLCPGHKVSLPSWILIIYHAIVSYLHSGTYRQGQGHSLHIFFPNHYLSWVSQMGMILHTIVIHDRGVVSAGGICPVRTCLVMTKLGIIRWKEKVKCKLALLLYAWTCWPLALSHVHCTPQVNILLILNKFFLIFIQKL